MCLAESLRQALHRDLNKYETYQPPSYEIAKLIEKGYCFILLQECGGFPVFTMLRLLGGNSENYLLETTSGVRLRLGKYKFAKHSWCSLKGYRRTDFGYIKFIFDGE